MLISIIIPVYNVEKYISRCLDSIVNQTYKDLQIIIVNDGSTDGGLNIIREYDDERIEIINKSNGGLSSARNAGLEVAKGEYVTFIDSDDWVDLTMIEKMISNAVANAADIVCVEEIVTNGDKISVINNKTTKTYTDSDCLTQLLSLRVKSYSWGKLYKREIFDNSECRFPVGMNYEDVATSYKFFSYCKRLVVLSEKLYFYYQRDNSITKTKRLKEVECILSHISEMQKYPISNNFWGFYKLKLLYGCYAYFLRLPSLEFDKDKYHDVFEEIKSLRRVIKLERTLFYYVFNKDFYKIFLMRTNLVKIALLK